MNVLLLGGSGQLGAEIVRRWKGCRISAPSHAALDVRAFDEQVLSGFDAVVNCAAFHDVDVCETESSEAFSVNAIAVDRMAAACAAQDVPFMTVSTDYVFDGKKRTPYVEGDVPRPLSTYGVSKFAGELLVERRRLRSFVVRTCGVYGTRSSTNKRTFIETVIRKAREGEPLRIVDDVVVSPTFAGHLAESMRRLLESDAFGLYHLCNSGAVSWYDFAVRALEMAGIRHPVQPISSEEWKSLAVRPRYSALTSEKLQDLGIAMPSWEDGIAAYLSSEAP